MNYKTNKAAPASKGSRRVGGAGDQGAWGISHPPGILGWDSVATVTNVGR